ncbi:MAG: C1 family peptidase [Bryobacteraceae bacterium]
MYAAPPAVLTALPPKVDLRPACPPVYEQGDLGSCTANAIAGAIQFDQLKQKLPDPFVPSRLFVYYNERVIEGTVDQDSGAMLRDGIKAIASEGVCPETQWRYAIDKFAAKPSDDCYKTALQHKALRYSRVVQTLSQMKGCLAGGYPFTIGFTVYDSFESDTVAKTGVAPMPAPKESALGGHAVLVAGYDDKSQRFTVRNSWGPGWGLQGYFTIPYAYFTDNNLGDDLWTVRLVQ